MLRLVPILLFTLSFIACSTCSEPGQGPGKPQDAVSDYFAALEKSDCKALRAAAGGELRKRIDKHGCDAALDDYREHGLRLVKIQSAGPDGRNPEAMLVRVVLLRDGKEVPVMLRVEKESGRWKLASL